MQVYATPVALNVLMHCTAECGVCDRPCANTFWFSEACSKPDTAKRLECIPLSLLAQALLLNNASGSPGKREN